MLKKILMFALIIIDLVLIFWLVSLIGPKDFGYFSLGYVISVFISAYVILMVDRYILKKHNHHPEDWRIKYLDNGAKVNYFRLLFVPIILVLGIVTIHFIGNPFWIGVKVAFSVTLYLVYRCQDFLFFLFNMQTILEEKINKFMEDRKE